MRDRYSNDGRLVFRTDIGGYTQLICKCEDEVQARKCVKTLNAESKSGRRSMRRDSYWLGKVIELEQENKRLCLLLDEHGNPIELARTEQLAAIHRKHQEYKSQVAGMNKAMADRNREIKELKARIEELETPTLP